MTEAVEQAGGAPRRRVLVLATHLSREYAGAAHAMITIIQALARTSWADVTVAAFTWDSSLMPPNVRLFQLHDTTWPDPLWRLSPLPDYWHALRLMSASSLGEFDLCYSQSIPLSLAFRRRQPKIPIVSHPGCILWDREVLAESSAPMRWRRVNARLARWLEHSTYREANWQHLVSSKLVGTIRATDFALDEQLFKVAPLPVDPKRFDPSKVDRDVRAELGLAASDFVAIVVARLVPLKRVDAVIRAVAAQSRPVVLLVVGDGPERTSLEMLARNLGVADRVRFVGRQDPPPYLAAANVFVLPSRIESFGLVYVEAMLMGLPCIGLRYSPPDILSAAGEVIGDEFGFCVSNDAELRDCIERLSGDPEKCRELGERARAAALARFTPDRYVATLREIAPH
jgi:glycosyltransferase involved in cell wall biosynthesis